LDGFRGTAAAAGARGSRGVRLSEAAWRRRFRASRVTLPSWARGRPDRLLYASNATGKFELYAWDRVEDRHRRLTDRPEGTTMGHLTPDGAQIWWFDDERGSEHGRWNAQPFSAGEARPAAPELPAAYAAGLSLGRSLTVVGLSDDQGSAIHVLQDARDPRLLYEHREYAEVGALTEAEDLVAINHSEHGDSRHLELRILDLAGNTVADLWDGPGKALEAVAWSPKIGDARLVVLHERQGRRAPGVWQSGREGLDELDLGLPGELYATWFYDATALLLRHQHAGRGELYRYELESRRLEPLATEPGSIDSARARPEGDVWYSWSSAAHPPEVRDLSGVVLRPEGEPAPTGVSYQDLRAGAVHCFLAEPAGPRPHPTIFLVHGGPASHDRDAFAPRVQAWVDHGFAVVLVNYRGSDGYGEAWRDGLEGNPGLTELEDIAAARELVVGQGIAEPGRLVLAGRSWGGYLTLLGLGTQPRLWSLGIAEVPVADYFAAFADEMEPLKAFDRALFGGSPDERPDFYRERSPLTHVDRVRAPVYITAGVNDPRCPLRQIENYVAALRSRELPHEVYRYEAGHASLVAEEQIRQLEGQIAFAARHLGTRAPLS
jgi:dienelactone hydrolase